MSRTLTYALVWQVALIFVMGACSSAESTQGPSNAPSPSANSAETDRADPAEDAGPPPDVVSQLIEEALQSDGSISYRALVDQLGSPRQVETEPVANQYVPDQTDTLRTLIYQGVEALMYDVTDAPKTFLVRLSLLSARYATPEGLRVGMEEKRVLAKVGTPTRRNASTGELIYQETEPTPTSMVLHVQAGEVTRIDWEFYFT